MELYIVRKKEKVIGVFDDLSVYFPKLKNEDYREGKPYKNCTIEKINLNEVTIKPNHIIYKGRNFTVNNIDDPLPLLEITDTQFL